MTPETGRSRRVIRRQGTARSAARLHDGRDRPPVLGKIAGSCTLTTPSTSPVAVTPGPDIPSCRADPCQGCADRLPDGGQDGFEDMPVVRPVDKLGEPGGAVAAIGRPRVRFQPVPAGNLADVPELGDEHRELPGPLHSSWTAVPEVGR